MARKDDIAQKLRAMLSDNAVVPDEAYGTGVAFSANAGIGKLREAAAAIDEAGFYLETITGLDFQDTKELVYHFNCYEPKSRFALRVLCDQSVPTLCDIFRAAEWLEREVHEFFGIMFENNPDMRRLLLPEDESSHPLKKDFGNVHAYHKREDIYG